jgi:hypothetical protein
MLHEGVIWAGLTCAIQSSVATVARIQIAGVPFIYTTDPANGERIEASASISSRTLGALTWSAAVDEAIGFGL